MIGIAKAIGRLIAVLVDAGIIERKQAVWILEPLKDKSEIEPQESNKNLCDSCITKGCIFQSGIVRNHCDFYKAKAESEDEK